MFFVGLHPLSKMSVLRDSPTFILFTFLYAFQGFCFGTTQTLFLYLKKAGFEYADIAILVGIISRKLATLHENRPRYNPNISMEISDYSTYRTFSIRFR